MEDYLKLFEITSDYEEYIDGDDALLPNVSYCEDENKVHFNPCVEPQFFAKLTLNNGEVVELQGSGELTSAMVSDQYKSTLVSAEIGELCTRIGNYAFCICSSLTSITIPDSVTIIGSSVFEGCKGLTSVTIGSGVTIFANTVFSGCLNLTSITCNVMIAPTIQSNTFQNIKTGGTLYVPTGSTDYDIWMDYLGEYNWTKVEQ